MENYPPELWGCITSFLPGEQLGRLKMTGYKNLWRRLIEPRSVKVLNLGEDALNFHRWPAFLNEFPGVEEFGIRNTDEYWWQKWDPKLSNVPQTLKKLRIHGPEDPTAAFFLSPSGTSLPLAASVPLLESLWVSAAWSSNLTAKVYPPNLTSLRCSSWNFQIPLPPTLNHFETRLLHAVKTDRCPLPPSLESFSIDTAPSSIIEFPSSLRSLKWYSPTSTTKFNALPKELVTLHINLKEKILYDPILQTAPNSLLSIPPNLVCLVIGSLPSQCWLYLPKTLQKLAITDLSSSSVTFSIPLPTSRKHTNLVDGEEPEPPIEVQTIPIHTLPNSLTYLSLSFWDLVFLDYASADGEEDEKHEEREDPEASAFSSVYRARTPSSKSNSKRAYQLFPPNLAYLTLFDVQMTPRAAAQLPPSLTYLHVNNLDADIFKHLPRRLRHLGSMKTKWTNPNLINELPASLTSLALRASLPGRSQWFDTTTGLLYTIGKPGQQTTEGKPGPQISSLPSLGLANPLTPTSALPSSESMDIDEIWEEPSIHLPSSLHKLTLDGLKELDHPLILKKIKYLAHLSLISSTLSHQAIAHFPRHLTNLQMRTTKTLSGKCFTDLPSQLIYLELTSTCPLPPNQTENEVVDFLDSDILSLPPNLSYLVLAPAASLTNECAKYLPKRLATFQINQNAKITPDIFPLLPCPMRSPQTYRSFVNKVFIISKGVLYRDRDLRN